GNLLGCLALTPQVYPNEASLSKTHVELQKKYRHFQLYPFNPGNERGDLHAKVLVVDRKRALVGSSNLSYNGLILNHEMAVLIDGQEAATIGVAIDRLTGHAGI
ncbi:MAG: phospholipase D family protein, partial [Chloroflexus sp.]|uniref:phospholipase D-like domain-containing protein n=1 Tax=Chloroflexus sp. TaxID=1904827 RepID=UPI0030A8617B